jgi:hypothetical protein
MSRFFQQFLYQEGIYAYVACCMLAVVLWLAWRYFSAVWWWIMRVWAEIRRPFIPWAWKSLGVILALGGILWLVRSPFVGILQFVDQRWLHPVYLERDTAVYVTDVYEAEMGKYLFPSEVAIVKRRTADMAARLGTTPLAIYQVALAECGMNAFVIRTDGVAAGWIQFTANGLSGFGYTLTEVKAACRARDINFIMDLTEVYLTTWAKGRPLRRPADVYACVFAPKFIGYPDEQTLYDTGDGDAYELNKGLDGYFVSTKNGRPIIMHSPSKRDGRITIADLDLCLESKKAKLIAAYRK